MKSLFSTFLAAFFTILLCGCPDNKLPKAPPKVPEPKAMQNTVPALMYEVTSQDRSQK